MDIVGRSCSRVMYGSHGSDVVFRGDVGMFCGHVVSCEKLLVMTLIVAF